MNPPQVYMCSPSRTLLPPPSPYHPSGSSQCTSPKHPVSCIKTGLVSLQSASRCNLPVGWEPLSCWLILQQASPDFSLGGDGRGGKGDKGREKRKRAWRKGRRKIRPLSSRLLRTKLRICTALIVFHLKKKKKHKSKTDFRSGKNNFIYWRKKLQNQVVWI